MRSFFRKSAALALLAALSFGGAAHALPISGSFTLYEDNPASLAIANGTFTTETALPNLTGYDVGDGSFLSTISLSSFSVIGIDPNFGNYTLNDPNTLEWVPLVAILAGTSPDRVIGFEGVLVNTTPMGQFLNLNLQQNGLTAKFTGGNMMIPGGVVSGIQLISEPSALALLGGGFIAFGLATRRWRISRHG